MRNDNARWDPPAEFGFEGDGFTVKEAKVDQQAYVSGVSVQTSFGPTIGWPDVAEGTRYAVSLRRDRVLLVGSHDVSPGYNPKTGVAVTDMTDGFTVLDIAGKHAFHVLKHGAELSLDRPSASASRLLFGVEVALYRYAASDQFRIHVPRARAQALFSSIRASAV